MLLYCVSINVSEWREWCIGLVAIEPNMEGLVKDLLESKIDLEILLSDSVPEQMIMQRSLLVLLPKWTAKEMAEFDMRYMTSEPTELMFTADVIAIPGRPE